MCYRLAHLYPAYLFCMLVALVLYSGGNPHQILFHLQNTSFYIHLFILQSYVPIDGYAFYYNGLAWAISTEVFFYLFFVLLSGISFHRLMTVTAIWGGAVLLLIIFVGYDISVPLWFFYINPFVRVFEFLSGMLLCEIYFKIKTRPTFKFLTGLEIFAIIFLLLFVFAASALNLSWLIRWQMFYVIPCGVLIFIFAFDGGRCSKFLATRVMQYLGKLAFPIYLTHQIALNFVKIIALPYLNSTLSLVIAGILGTVLSILCSMLLNKFLIEPANSFLKDLTNRFTVR